MLLLFYLMFFILRFLFLALFLYFKVVWLLCSGSLSARPRDCLFSFSVRLSYIFSEVLEVEPSNDSTIEQASFESLKVCPIRCLGSMVFSCLGKGRSSIEKPVTDTNNQSRSGEGFRWNALLR